MLRVKQDLKRRKDNMEYEYREEVKKRSGLQGNDYQNDSIDGMIEDVLYFMIDAGVSEKVAYSKKAIGAVTRGVIDSWNMDSDGKTDFSPLFYKRLSQLCYGKEENADV